jgi:DNA-binding beta-propeller fold protein YncE
MLARPGGPRQAAPYAHRVGDSSTRCRPLRLAWLTICLATLGGAALPSVSPARQVYVANYTSATVAPFSIEAGGALTPIACPGSTCNPTGNPEGAVASPDGRYLYVAASDTISPFSIGADGSLTPIACGLNCNAGLAPQGVAVAPNGRVVYAANLASNDVSPFSIGADGSLTPIACPGSSCDTGANPYGVAVSPDGRFLYTANSGSNTVSVFSIDGGGAITPVACPGSSCDTGSSPASITITPDGRHLYAGNLSSNTVSGFSIAADGTLTPIACPGSSCDTDNTPYGVTTSADGRFLYAANIGSDRVSVSAIAADGTLMPIACSGTSCDTASAPIGIATSGNALYVSDNGANLVSPFSIGQDGALSPIACSSCNTGTSPAFQSITVTADTPPTAAFSATPAPAGLSSRFDAAASRAAAGQTLARFDWDFGDGSGAQNAGPDPSHTYAAGGAYTVKLTLTDDAGCSSAQIYTGQTAVCTGGASAIESHSVAVPSPLTKGPPPGDTNFTLIKASGSARSGTLVLTLSAKGAGSFDLLGTHWVRPAHSSVLRPGHGRVAYARAHSKLSAAGRLTVRLRPTAGGRRLLTRHKGRGWPLNIRVWVSYTPTGGTTVTRPFPVRVLRG